jgi:hypothetical protein
MKMAFVMTRIRMGYINCAISCIWMGMGMGFNGMRRSLLSVWGYEMLYSVRLRSWADDTEFIEVAMRYAILI